MKLLYIFLAILLTGCMDMPPPKLSSYQAKKQTQKIIYKEKIVSLFIRDNLKSKEVKK